MTLLKRITSSRALPLSMTSHHDSQILNDDLSRIDEKLRMRNRSRHFPMEQIEVNAPSSTRQRGYVSNDMHERLSTEEKQVVSIV